MNKIEFGIVNESGNVPFDGEVETSELFRKITNKIGISTVGMLSTLNGAFSFKGHIDSSKMYEFSEYIKGLGVINSFKTEVK